MCYKDGKKRQSNDKNYRNINNIHNPIYDYRINNNDHKKYSNYIDNRLNKNNINNINNYSPMNNKNGLNRNKFINYGSIIINNNPLNAKNNNNHLNSKNDKKGSNLVNKNSDRINLKNNEINKNNLNKISIFKTKSPLNINNHSNSNKKHINLNNIDNQKNNANRDIFGNKNHSQKKDNNNKSFKHKKFNDNNKRLDNKRLFNNISNNNNTKINNNESNNKKNSNNNKSNVLDALKLKINESSNHKEKIEIKNNIKRNKKIRLENDKITTDSKDDLLEVASIKNKDNFKEWRNIIENTLFSQLSKINVKLLNFDETISKQLFPEEKGKILPKIDLIEFKLLSHNESISKFKDYGYGLYVFFLYLINLLITFGILFIFAFYYIYCIFFKYYRNYELEYSLFFDYNILSLVSGVQIIKFRNYYIETFGKFKFLEKYKDFDVFYKEYFYTGFIILIIIFFIDLIFLVYLLMDYQIFKINNPQIKDYSLIISGEGLRDINNDNNNQDKIKKEILKKLDLIDDQVDNINSTLKLFDYYVKMEKLISLKSEKYKIDYKIKNEKCCCYICFCFSKLFYCCFRDKNYIKQKNINNEIEKIKNELNDFKNKEEYNPLYIITFKNKEYYKEVYSKKPHYYIMNICKKKSSREIYINKAPNPEEIAWENLQFGKEERYFKNKLENLGISSIYIIISFGIQILGEIVDKFTNNIKYSFIVNIIISYFLGLLDSLFFEKINFLLAKNSKLWSYSDIKFYSILFQSIFKLINKGIFPLVTYFIFNDKKKDNFSNLVSKMFIIIEMDGFGYPMIDWFYTVILTKGKNMYEITKKIMIKDIEEEYLKYDNNNNNLDELRELYEKKEIDLEGNYSDILAIYWITMFYACIYPVGIIQSFLNLFFMFIIEKNFLLNAYKRPEYINPQFGFFCFNFFNFGFFLFLCGNIIFFKNEDNKESFGVAYIIIMIVLLIIPIFLIPKLFRYLANYSYLKEKERIDLNKNDYKLYNIFNPYYQKDKIKELFSDYQKEILESSRIDEIKTKLEKLNNFDLYKLQKNFRIQKQITIEEREVNSEFIYDNPSKKIKENDEKYNLYYFLIQLGFLSYLEGKNILRPSKKRFKFSAENKIRSISLKNLSIQENLSNCDYGYFALFNNDSIDNNNRKELFMAYAENKINSKIKIFDVFERKFIENHNDNNLNYKIVCLNSYTLEKENNKIYYIIYITLDNSLTITYYLNKFSKNSYNKINVREVGDTFEDNNYKSKSTFSLSTVRHDNNIWIITSYYYDKSYKIFAQNKNFENPMIVKNKDYIISLEALFYTEANTYICTRSDSKINLFINNLYIKCIFKTDIGVDSYINFKILKSGYSNYYVIIIEINKDSTSYNIQIININNIFPWFRKINYAPFLDNITFGPFINPDINRTFNKKMRKKYKKNKEESIFNMENIKYNIKEPRPTQKQVDYFKEENDNDKYNIGNILLWEKGYLIVGTPYNYLDIIDYKNKQKIGTINNDNVIYNISEEINDPEYGSCFIMRDKNGKIQYIRPIKESDKLNFRIVKSEKYYTDFNGLDDDIKLTHILFSTRFYFFYSFLSNLIPLITGFIGHYYKDKNNNNISKLNIKLIIASFIIYLLYAFFGIWFKGCVHDIKDEVHTKRTCTKITIILVLLLKICANSMLSYAFCYGKKAGIIFILMLFLLYLVHLIINFIIYCFKIKFLLRTYWIAFIFYQISRFCILVFFILSIVFKATHIETYVYAGILCIILIYMYMSNYFNTLLKNITYSSYIQAIFNYPFEWMNLFCCCCINPQKCIKKIDKRCCFCDKICLTFFQLIIMLMTFICYCFYYCICNIICGKKDNQNNNNDNDIDDDIDDDNDTVD